MAGRKRTAAEAFAEMKDSLTFRSYACECDSSDTVLCTSGCTICDSSDLEDFEIGHM